MDQRSLWQERLESVRQRIRILRDVLSDPSSLSEIAIDGVSEKVQRSQLVKELKELEIEESTLLSQLSGRSSRLFKVDLH